MTYKILLAAGALLLGGCTYGRLTVHREGPVLAEARYLSLLQKKSLTIDRRGELRYSTDSQAAVEMLRESRLGWERAYQLGARAAAGGDLP